MSSFEPGDRVSVMDLRTATRHDGIVEEVGGDGFLVVVYTDNNQRVRVGRGFVSHKPVEPSDTETYGAGS